MTTTAPPSAPSTPPSSDGSAQEQQDQQQFMKAANGFNLAYGHTQELVQDLQTDLATTTSFYGLVRDFAVLDQLCEWVSATQMMTETCASSIDGLMQGAEEIFSNGINEINSLSQQNWEGQSVDGMDPSEWNMGIPLLTPDGLNTMFSTQVDQAALFISYLQVIYYDVSGAAFTGTNLKTGEAVNPLSSISTGVEDDCQDFMYQMVETYNQMQTATLTQVGDYDSDGTEYPVYIYTPSNSSSSYSGTYEQSGEGGNYLFDTTDYTSSTSSPISTNASPADVMCYAMMDWFYVYDSPAEYDYDGSTSSVSAPDTSQNESAYQVATDFQGINAETSGVSQQIIPVIAFLSNLQKNSLSMVYQILSSLANIETQTVSNMKG